MTTQVLIVGAGAIGAFYGALLARQGVAVSVVCRSDYQHVKTHGFAIDSADLGQWVFRPQQVLKTAADYQGQADYVFLCTKVLHDADRIKLIRGAAGPNTSIVLLQNGVEIEHAIADAFPDHDLISGLAFICSNRLQPGKISHMAYGKLVFGNYPNACKSKTQQLCALFKNTGIPCHSTADIITARWQKNVWNAPFNPLSVLSGGLLTHDILIHQETLVRHIMQEICAIAAALGHPLHENIINFNIDSTKAIAPYKTSMLVDYQNHRTMETEAILGNAIRAGQRVAVPCPHLQTVYALMKLKEIHLLRNNLE